MSNELKRMTDLLKSGATMMSEACPQCSSPLFEVKGNIFCAKCNKPVVIVKGSEEEVKIRSDGLMSMLEDTLIRKIQEVNTALDHESDTGKSMELSNLMSSLLDNMERIRRLKQF